VETFQVYVHVVDKGTHLWPCICPSDGAVPAILATTCVGPLLHVWWLVNTQRTAYWYLFFFLLLCTATRNRSAVWHIFMRVRVVAKIAFAFVTTVRLSACISAAPNGQISAKLNMGNCMKICGDQPHWVKIKHKNFWDYTYRARYAIALLGEALHYEPEGRGFISRWVPWKIQWLNPSGCIMALGSTQPVTEMSTRNLSWG
jgi:hypothetical protein